MQIGTVVVLSARVRARIAHRCAVCGRRCSRATNEIELRAGDAQLVVCSVDCESEARDLSRS